MSDYHAIKRKYTMLQSAKDLMGLDPGPPEAEAEEAPKKPTPAAAPTAPTYSPARKEFQDAWNKKNGS